MVTVPSEVILDGFGVIPFFLFRRHQFLFRHLKKIGDAVYPNPIQPPLRLHGEIHLVQARPQKSAPTHRLLQGEMLDKTLPSLFP